MTLEMTWNTLVMMVETLNVLAACATVTLVLSHFECETDKALL